MDRGPACIYFKKWAYLYIISIYKSIYSLYISTRALCLYYYNYYMTMLLYCLTCFAGDNCKEKQDILLRKIKKKVGVVDVV